MSARILREELLSDNWGVLKKITFELTRLDGEVEVQTREVYDRGHGAAVLPYDTARGTVLLIRQFRLPALTVGHAEPLVEVCAGLLDADDPETCIRKEASEELGYRVGEATLVFDAFMSPGSVNERLSLFIAPYRAADRIGEGGGAADEGEDIEVLELPFAEALAMVADRRIIDGKTIMLIQHLALSGLMAS